MTVPGIDPVATPSREERRFASFLRTRKLKLTQERLAILASVFRHSSHFDAEGLSDQLRRQAAGISRATVYRTLDLLVQCGLVRKSSLGASHASYEVARENEHHDHLICLNCNRVLEFFSPDLERLQDQICSGHAFKALHHSLQIFGLCDQCRDRADEAQAAQRVSHLHT